MITKHLLLLSWQGNFLLLIIHLQYLCKDHFPNLLLQPSLPRPCHLLLVAYYVKYKLLAFPFSLSKLLTGCPTGVQSLVWSRSGWLTVLVSLLHHLRFPHQHWHAVSYPWVRFYRVMETATMVLCRNWTLHGVNVLLGYQVQADAVRSHGLTTNEEGLPHTEQTSGCSSLFN